MPKEEVITCIMKDLEQIAPISRWDKEKWANFARVKVSININEPLKTRLALPIPDEVNHQAWILYEKLPHFCLFCGTIRHDKSGCKWISEVDFALNNEEMNKDEQHQLQKFLGSIFNEENYRPPLLPNHITLGLLVTSAPLQASFTGLTTFAANLSSKP